MSAFAYVSTFALVSAFALVSQLVFSFALVSALDFVSAFALVSAFAFVSADTKNQSQNPEKEKKLNLFEVSHPQGPKDKRTILIK